MRWLEKIEKRFDWLAFPGLYKYTFFLGVFVFVAQWARPDISSLLEFDHGRILRGEIWRLFSYILAPFGYMQFDVKGMVGLFFGLQMAVIVSDSLDDHWGATRTTLYLIVSWLSILALQWLIGISVPWFGFIVLMPAFYAFATYFPRYEILLFMILPIQVRFIAWAGVLGMVMMIFRAPAMILVLIPAMLPYLIWVVPDFFNGAVRLAGSAARRAKFSSRQLNTGEAFHRCEDCGRTEKTDPHLDFFTTTDGREYCADHVPAKDPAKP